MERDGCAIEGALGQLIREWFDRNPDGLTDAAGRAVGRLTWLAGRAGVSASTIEKIMRKSDVDGVQVEYRIAEPIVAAIGRPELLHNGTLRVVVNRKAPLGARRECERHLRCCGGSTPVRATVTAATGRTVPELARATGYAPETLEFVLQDELALGRVTVTTGGEWALTASGHAAADALRHFPG